jgi:hypothetical protein
MIRAAVAGGTGILGTDATAIRVTGVTDADRVCRACTTPGETSGRKVSFFTTEHTEVTETDRKKGWMRRTPSFPPTSVFSVLSVVKRLSPFPIARRSF